MPIFKVNSPDGQVIEVEAPENATDADLISRALAQKAPTRPTATGTERLLASMPGRYAKGLKDPIDAGAQMLPRVLSSVASGFGHFPNSVSNWLDSESQRVSDDIRGSEQEYQTARWKAGQTGFDGARITGNIVNPTNVAIAARLPTAATTLGRIGAGALGGAVGGSLQPVTEATDSGDGPSFAALKAGQIASGGVGGAALGPIVGKLGDVLAPRIKAVMSRLGGGQAALAQAQRETDQAVLQALNDAGMPANSLPPEMVAQLREQVLAAIRSGQRLDPAAQLRKNEFAAQGVPALTGQITRDPKQYSSQLNLRGVAGVGEPVQNLLAAQNQKIGADLAKFGGTEARDRVAAGELFNGALKKLDERLSGEVSRAYQNARASSGKDWDVPMGKLAGDVADVLDTFGVGGEKNAVPSAIASKLKSFGIVNDPAMTQRKVFNYEEADKLLKQINAHDDGGNASLGALRSAVKSALSEAGGEGDPFKVARQMAASRFSLLDAVPALDAVAKGAVPADDFVKRFIINGKTNDLKKLAEVLPADALDEARKQIAKVIHDGAFKNNTAGDKLASPGGMKGAMDAIGPEKLKLFFSPKQIEELNRITRLTAYANSEPAWGTVARGGNPGGVLFDSLARTPGLATAGRFAPLIGALRQSQAVNSALLGTVPKAANLTPEEVRMMSGLLGGANVAAGGLLAP